MPRLAIPLSDLQCRTAKTRERAYKLFDGGGMYLFVKPNGVKTWRLKYTKPNGKEGTLIIGNYPIVTLSVARRKRDEAKALLLDNLDPMEEKKKAKIVAQRAALLFETVALEWHADMSRRWTEGHAKTVMSRLRTHVFPLIGQRPIAELDTHDLLEITQRIKESNRVRAAYIHKAEFLEQRWLIMAWWSNYIDANRSGHVTPHEFAHPVGNNITALQNSRGASKRG